MKRLRAAAPAAREATLAWDGFGGFATGRSPQPVGTTSASLDAKPNIHAKRLPQVLP